ncbi:MAG: TonB-dependent receptor plug domain-containing protein, partial [Thiotrichaceae bacterium]|nr:TonB-dependent receptor plug domain-containing protein [Thiotrichaceae bacterium]
MNTSITSATKHPEEARTIPASISIIPRSEINQYGYTTLVELFKNIPGFYINNNTEDQKIGTRGTIGGGIQFLVNGVPQHPSTVKGLTIPEISRFNIPVESIDSIEVVRGPMSVMYGNNAFKGSINIITNDIENQGSMIAAGYGSQDTSKIFARFGETLDDGFVSLNFGLYQTDGLGGQYKDMMSAAQLADLDPAMHTSLHKDVTHDNLSIDFSAAWQNFSANIRYSDMDYGFYALTPSFGRGNQISLETFNGMLGYKTELTETLTFNSSVIYSHEEYDLPQVDFANSSVQNSDISQFQETSRAEVELNLMYQPNDDFSLLTGYRYRRIFNSLNDAHFAA